MESLREILDELNSLGLIINYHVKLSVNQQITVFIISNQIHSVEDLKTTINEIEKFTGLDIDLYNSSVLFEFFNSEEGDEKNYYFENGKMSFGLRRSLDNLIDNEVNKNSELSNIITFYSHKGGVGRTTSLALLSRYYSDIGKTVFIIDCDFEAPGLLNFFSISQFDTPKNGVVEYLNDKRFDHNTSLNEDYVYEISNRYTGDGKIYLMPAGNIFSEEKNHYLEGLSRLDLFGPSMFLNDMKNLINDIKINFSPDVILIDSRTGFNNVFGVLSKLSSHIVALFGDDTQNKPGIEFILDKFSDNKLHTKITVVLSIVSANFRKRHNAFNEMINGFMEEYDNDIIIPSFVFPREQALELIGTPEESEDDFKYFSSVDSPTSYSPFLSHMKNVLSKIEAKTEDKAEDKIEDKIEDKVEDKIEDKIEDKVEDKVEDKIEDKAEDSHLSQQIISIDNKFNYKDQLLKDLYDNFPELYAENVIMREDYLKGELYLRKCMQDIFLYEYKFLIGGKGTGKTYFYKALQNRNFVDALLIRSEKKRNEFDTLNIISDANSTEGFLELTAHFSNEMTNESFVRKVWVIYIWVMLSKYEDFKVHSSCDFTIKNDAMTIACINEIIGDADKYLEVEKEISIFDRLLKTNNKYLIVTFDQLDAVVKPISWDLGISPLIRLCLTNSWERIHPKLFLRRDLFQKLGNITNKQSLTSQAIDLEWSKEEMYAFFFKIVYSKSNNSFLDFLNSNFSSSFVNDQILKRLRRKNSYNQLPDDEFILRDLVNKFFGNPSYDYIDAYEALYRNIRNANTTISLRPFLDMIKFAIEAQNSDSTKKQKDAVLGIYYCFLRSVRAKAVERYFQDMAQEAGNDIIKYFIEDIQNDNVPENLKCSSLVQRDFEKLVEVVKTNHPDIAKVPMTTFEEMLVLNGIIFVTLIPGGIKKYSFAYLYKFYLNLKSPARRKKTSKNY